MQTWSFYSLQEYVVKTVPKSKYSMQELKMLHYCTHHCPMAVTNLIQVYENCLTHSDDQQFKITYHLFILEKMNRGSLFDYISLLEHEYSEHQIRLLTEFRCLFFIFSCANLFSTCQPIAHSIYHGWRSFLFQACTFDSFPNDALTI